MSYHDDYIDSSFAVSPISEGSVHPPLLLIYFGVLQLVVLLVLLFPDGRPLHWVGYLVGAVLVPITVSTYRNIDRTRQCSRSYVSPAWVSRFPTSILATGIALAVAHAYFLALDTRLA